MMNMKRILSFSVVAMSLMLTSCVMYGPPAPRYYGVRPVVLTQTAVSYNYRQVNHGNFSRVKVKGVFRSY